MLQKLFNPEWQITSKSFLLSSFLTGFSFSPTVEISRLELEFEESLPRRVLDRSRDLACVSQNTRKLLGPEDFSGLFSGEFLGSRKAFLNAPENTPDSHPSFSGCFLGSAARA